MAGERMREIEFGGRPGDERGFIHKKILGTISTISGIVPGGGFVSRITGALAGRGQKERGRQLKLGPEREFGRQPLGTSLAARGPDGDGCVFPWRRDQFGKCSIFIGERKGPNGDAPVGDAVMGRYGAALQPGIMTIDRSVCLRGMQLGNDGLCYNRGQISNTQRMWPRGRRPLLTGGDMRAIGVASRAGKKLDRTTKRLRALGMMKALPKGRSAPKSRGTVVKEAGAGSVTIQ